MTGAVLFIASAAGFAQSAGSRASTGDFVGAWRLARLSEQAADGTPHTVTCCGMIVFTRDGHVSVQVMQKEALQTVSSGPEQYSQGGYEASYGAYAVDPRTHTFTFHVDGALVRTLIGKDLPRSYEFTGKQLIVKPARPDEHWEVVWERY
jgi:hypothetical protein